MTGSPAGPIDAPIGSAAAEASVAAGAGAAVVVVELVELAELSVEGEDEVEDAGARGSRARRVGEVDRLKADAGLIGELLQLNEQTGLISIRGNGLAEHDQLSIVIREGPSCLLAGRNRLLVLCELGLELANVLLERARL